MVQVVHTYPQLLTEHAHLLEEVQRVQTALTAATTPAPKNAPTTDDELDRFMAELAATDVVDKGKISALKVKFTISN